MYGFDTGFVAFTRGWSTLRDEDRGPLWEHLVLDVLRARPGGGAIAYWRDKSGREIDFVLSRGRTADAIECKVNPDWFDPDSLRAFRQAFPRGRNLLVAPGVTNPHDVRYGEFVVRVLGCQHLLDTRTQVG